MIKSVSVLASVSGAAVVALGMMTVPMSSAQACGSDSYTGSICMMAGSYCPVGTVQLSAPQSLPQNYNQALMALLGTNYGTSSGQVVLPNLGARSIVGTNGIYSDGISPTVANLPLATYRGNVAQILNIGQMPTHTHAATFTVDTSQMKPALKIQANPAPGGFSQISAANPYLSGSNTPMWTSAIQSPVNVVPVSATVTGGFSTGSVTNAATGTGAAFQLVPPSVGLNMCLVTDGYYPVRP